MQPSVVLVVSATWSGSAPTSAAMRVAQLLAQLHHASEVRPAAAAVAIVPLELRAASPRSVGAGDRAERAGIEVRDLLEHRKLRPCLLEGHADRRRPEAAIACSDATRHPFGGSHGRRRRSRESLGLADARRDRRSPRLHAAVRLRARRRARPAGRRRAAAHVAASASAPCRRPTDSRSTTASIASRPGRARRAVRLAVKALEHPLALARLGLADCDLLHLQWVAAPEADGLLLHTRRPLVFTAHDLLPRRTASHTRTWKRLFGRFDRIVTHSERGRRTLADVRRRPRASCGSSRHPAFRSDPARRDDGRTVLALGVIRPYKGLPDAIEAVSADRRCATARRRRSADPDRRAPSSRRAIAPSGGSATWARTRWPTRSARRPSPSSPTAPSSTSPARCCR